MQIAALLAKNPARNLPLGDPAKRAAGVSRTGGMMEPDHVGGSVAKWTDSRKAVRLASL